MLVRVSAPGAMMPVSPAYFAKTMGDQIRAHAEGRAEHISPEMFDKYKAEDRLPELFAMFVSAVFEDTATEVFGPQK